jgi:hypothetical protein
LFFAIDHCIFFFFFLLCGRFSPRLDLTPSYHVHFPTLISIAPTLVPYLLSSTDIATLIISYPIDLAIVLTTYPTKLATLLITYPINLTTILTTYPTDLATLHTQPIVEIMPYCNHFGLINAYFTKFCLPNLLLNGHYYTSFHVIIISMYYWIMV